MLKESMKLAGGIEMYSSFEKRYENDIPPLGRKVYFLNANGWDGEKELASKYFKENEVLTVKEIYVDRSSSEVEFLEQPNKRFNTAMFADVE